MKKKWTLILMMAVLVVLISGTALAHQSIGLFVNEGRIASDVEPQIIGDRVMVPIRWVAEALGSQVHWDAAERNVHIQAESDHSEQQRIDQLEAWIQPDSAEEVVDTWAKATQFRNGAVQYAMLSSGLQEQLLAQYEAVHWVTGVSSPWLEQYILTQLETGEDKHVYEVTFETATSTGPAGTGKVGVTVERLDDQWTITSLEDIRDASLLPGVIMPAADDMQGTIAATADQLLDALAEKDMDAVSAFIHPKKGVRFSPYSYVDAAQHVVFVPQEVETFFDDETEYEWGTYDGKGDPIVLTPAQYYDEFIFDLDFRNADEVSYNEQLFQGNMINNAPDVYPGAMIVEYHFEGIEEQYAGMDWRSLRFVFESFSDDWKLVGIIHDEWTI